MEIINQNIVGQSTKDTVVAPAFQIITEAEYIELFGTGSDDETFMEIGVILG